MHITSKHDPDFIVVVYTEKINLLIPKNAVWSTILILQGNNPTVDLQDAECMQEEKASVDLMFQL